MTSLAPNPRSNYKDSKEKPIMEDRIGFKKEKIRKTFFNEVRFASKSKTWKDLATKLKTSRAFFQKYQHGKIMLSKSRFDKLLSSLPLKRRKFYETQIITKPGNWGCIKGGIKGIRIIYSKYPKEVTRKWKQKAGRNSIRKINEYKKSLPEKERILFHRTTKLTKAVQELHLREKEGEIFFHPKEITFDLSNIQFSRYDKKRQIILPKKLSPELAEEIGIHLGDGTLSKNKNYFSVRGGYAEEDYYTDYILPLYKRIYNINPPLLKRSDACGFEISSKGIKEFKSKVLGIVTGVKTYVIEVPSCIMESRDKEIYNAFLRGIIDTDGCYYYSEQKQYPVISLGLKSIPLLKKVNEILKLLGYKPYFHKKSYQIQINGFPQFKKWTDEIGSSSPKNQKRIANIKKTLLWSSLDMILACGASDSGSNPDGGTYSQMK